MRYTFLNNEFESQVDLAHADYKVYTLHDMAKMFRVSLRTIYNWMDSYKFSYVKVGSKTYITDEQLKEFLATHQVEALNREGGVK